MSTHKMHGNGSFISGSVRLVDYHNTSGSNYNVLVRGSSAFGALNGSQEFQVSDLIAAIQADSNFKQSGITLSDNPQIIDFCLIGFVPGHKDQHIVDAEMSWFTSNPPTLNGGAGPYPTYVPASSGQNMMIYWPIQAIGGNPPTQVNGTWNPSPVNSIGNGPGQFDYAGLIPAIRAALTNNTSELPNWTGGDITNAIIYVHCDSGVNRTGAAVCGYLMCNGTNVAGMNLARTTSAQPHTLAKAQAAANSAPPSNDTSPAGGCDIWVTQAYCNLLYTKNIDGALVQECVPNPIPC